MVAVNLTDSPMIKVLTEDLIVVLVLSAPTFKLRDVEVLVRSFGSPA